MIPKRALYYAYATYDSNFLSFLPDNKTCMWYDTVIMEDDVFFFFVLVLVRLFSAFFFFNLISC